MSTSTEILVSTQVPVLQFWLYFIYVLSSNTWPTSANHDRPTYQIKNLLSSDKMSVQYLLSVALDRNQYTLHAQCGMGFDRALVAIGQCESPDAWGKHQWQNSGHTTYMNKI